MRGDSRLKFLEWIDEVGGGISDFLESFFVAGYGASFKRMEYLRNKAESGRLRDRDQREKEQWLRQRYYDFLYHLKEDGLIQKDGEDKFKLTLKGRFKIKELAKAKKCALPSVSYSREDSESVIIVTFDIPEKDRRKRAWLRSALKNIAYA